MAACSDNSQPESLGATAAALPGIVVDSNGNISTVTPGGKAPVQSTVEAIQATAQSGNSNNPVATTAAGNKTTPTAATNNQPTTTTGKTSPVPSSPSPVKGNPTAKPTLAPTPTPTPSGEVKAIDKAAELKIVQKAYDAINKNLYKEPDNTAILGAGLNELSLATGAAPPKVKFEGDKDAQWKQFTEQYDLMLSAAILKGYQAAPGDLAHRIVNSMADSVQDEHTYFLNQSGYESRNKLLQGDNSTIGFGISVSTEDPVHLYIVRVVAGAPADKAGIKPGDELISYDGQRIDAKSFQIVRNAKENETHTFTIKRLGQDQLLEIKATKAVYTSPTVESRIINGNIGYIAIRSFFTNVAQETDRAMVDLRKQGATSWILDVRGNPGGVYVDQVVGRFVKGGEVMGYNSNREGRDELKVSNKGVKISANDKPFSPVLPLVLLLDENSASSSEMLALAVRDFKLGKLIGQKSAGALGHTVAYALGDNTAISVTVDEYESRSGTKVNGIDKGVEPDIAVEMTVEDLVKGRDPQLAVAITEIQKAVVAKK